jgi:hypothetical protein
LGKVLTFIEGFTVSLMPLILSRIAHRVDTRAFPFGCPSQLIGSQPVPTEGDSAVHNGYSLKRLDSDASSLRKTLVESNRG